MAQKQSNTNLSTLTIQFYESTGSDAQHARMAVRPDDGGRSIHSAQCRQKRAHEQPCRLQIPVIVQGVWIPGWERCTLWFPRSARADIFRSS